MRINYLIGPSIGALDIWHPILRSLRNSDIHIRLLVTKVDIIDQIDPCNLIHQEIEQLFTSFVYLTPAASYEFSSLSDFLLYRNLYIRPLRRSSSPKEYFQSVLARLFAIKSTPISCNTLDLDDLCSDLLLYDAFEELKAYNQHIHPLFFKAKQKFHILHGLGIFPPGSPKTEEPYPYNLTYFLQGPTEKHYYASLFINSSKSNFVVTGVPRHDGEYSASLQSTSLCHLDSLLHSNRPKGLVALLVGRSSISYYYGTSRCFRQSIRDLEDTFVRNQNNTLLIKKHPRDKRLPKPFRKLLSTYANCLEVDLPPLYLAPFIDLAFTSHSGTCVDFAFYKVPSIEHINVALAKDLYHDTSNSIYHQSGMAISSHTQDDLSSLLADVSLDAHAASAFQAYERLYKNPEGSINRIVSEITVYAQD